MPFIEKNHRVTPVPENRALAGLSMDGGQTFYTGLRHPDMFAGLFSFSTDLFGGVGQSAESTFDPEPVIPAS